MFFFWGMKTCNFKLILGFDTLLMLGTRGSEVVNSESQPNVMKFVSVSQLHPVKNYGQRIPGISEFLRILKVLSVI